MKIYKILFILAISSFFANCTKEEKVETDAIVENDNSINFGVGQDIDTKTEYYDNGLKIRWTNGDIVRIFATDGTSTSNADYNVVSNGTDAKATLTAVSNNLSWLSTANHNFVAVYPADERVSYNDNILTLKAQISKSVSITKTGTEYELSPEMKNEYLVVSKSGVKPSKEKVELQFSPIMTAYEVTITNKNAVETALTGIIVSYDNKNGYVNKDGNFMYNPETKGMTAYTSDFIDKVNFAYYMAGGAAGHIDLQPNEKVKVTLFLPPFPDLADGSKKLTLKVLAGNFSNISAEINHTDASTKNYLTVDLKENNNGDNWIEDIDDDVLASKLSIPCAAYAGMEYTDQNSSTGSSYTYTGSSYGTQHYCVEKLWAMGVRAFDFHSGADFCANHLRYTTLVTGYTTYSAKYLIEFLKKKLQGSKEFAIVFFRIEANSSQSAAYKAYKEMVDYYWNSGLGIEFKNNLTVGDLRGKVLMIGLEYGTNNLSNIRFSANIQTDGWPGGGYLSKGYADILQKSGNLKSKDGTTTGTMIAQEWLEVSQQFREKKDLIDRQIKLINNNTYKETDTWSYLTTHCYSADGYNANGNAGGQGSVLSELEQNGIYIFKYFSKQVPVPMGIISTTFIGIRKFNNVGGASYWTYGDVLPNLLISHNFTQNLMKYNKTTGEYYY